METGTGKLNILFTSYTLSPEIQDNSEMSIGLRFRIILNVRVTIRIRVRFIILIITLILTVDVLLT